MKSKKYKIIMINQQNIKDKINQALLNIDNDFITRMENKINKISMEIRFVKAINKEDLKTRNRNKINIITDMEQMGLLHV